ncbi:phage tail protein [Burkholderia ubonensis]|uniref:phage tail protein n=1 Tax=Burkholderia ubonensis TaxID=101571 RepID=UPI000756076C|nr:phage tail protein [Burkholderia ubonensis]KVQ19408.1 phage tail protein [Burkholderia ubonensis]KWI87057.1 phage tail protein [Burkholderia ubonensis]KWK12617.1 phage tail protein [Burkholderia ubonensis]KWK13770.1 phage tail protein [Burkholderia ubonensis]KWK41139.1 phage tail protein [Burkholderia ubonensis]
MNKPDSLRRALVAAVPALGTDPGKLTVLVEQGSLAATGTLTPSFEYRYVARVLAPNFTGDADPVFVALVEWVRANQPDLVTNPAARADGITFEMSVRDPALVDLSIKLALTESVVVTTGPDGKQIVTHVDDTQVDPANTLTWVALPQRGAA